MTTNSPDASGTSSPPGLPEVLNRPHRPINMVAGTIGHFVEWYDWYIYGLLAAVFASQIFPSHSPFASLIAALLTYAIGFVDPPLQRNHHLPAGRPLRPTGRPDPVRLRDGARLPDHRPHPRVRHDRLRGTDPLRGGPHPAGHLGRQRAAERHLVHGRARPPEQERPVRFLLQHGQRPGDPRRDRFRRDRDRSLRSGRRSPPGVGASRSSSAASSAWSVSSCGPAPTRPPSSRPAPSSTRSPRRHGCWPCSANTRRLCCRQRRCPPRPWPTTPGRPSCPPTPSSPPAGTRPPP